MAEFRSSPASIFHDIQENYINWAVLAVGKQFKFHLKDENPNDRILKQLIELDNETKLRDIVRQNSMDKVHSLLSKVRDTNGQYGLFLQLKKLSVDGYEVLLAVHTCSIESTPGFETEEEYDQMRFICNNLTSLWTKIVDCQNTLKELTGKKHKKKRNKQNKKLRELFYEEETFLRKVFNQKNVVGFDIVFV